jgi:hypothetical protein
MVANALRLDPGLLRPALDHLPGPLPIEASPAEHLGLPVHRAEEGTVLVLPNASRLDIGER